MTRRFLWPTAAILLLAAVAFFLLFRDPAPSGSAIGCADAELLFKSSREFQLLKNLRASFEADAERWRGAASGPRANLNFPSIALGAESVRLSEGFADRSRNLSFLMADSALDALRRDYRAYLDVYALEDSRAFDAASKRLESIYRQINRPDPDDPMGEEKFRLFSLRLKLRVLTRDPYVFSDDRLARIESEIDSLRSDIDSYELGRLHKLKQEYENASLDEREAFIAGSKRRERELKDRAASMLEESETILSMVADAHRAEMESRADSSSSERRRVVLSAAAARVSPSLPPSSSVLDAIEIELKKEFMRRLHRRAPAVAEKLSLSYILISPNPIPPGAIDVTDEFKW